MTRRGTKCMYTSNKANYIPKNEDCLTVKKPTVSTLTTNYHMLIYLCNISEKYMKKLSKSPLILGKRAPPPTHTRTHTHTFCLVLTSCIIHVYISPYLNMNNAGGIRGERRGRGADGREGHRHSMRPWLRSPLLHTPRRGAGGEVGARCKGFGRGCATPGPALSPLPLPLPPPLGASLPCLPACPLAACLPAYLAAATSSDLITLYKSKVSCQPHSLH